MEEQRRWKAKSKDGRILCRCVSKLSIGSSAGQFPSPADSEYVLSRAYSLWPADFITLNFSESRHRESYVGTVSLVPQTTGEAEPALCRAAVALLQEMGFHILTSLLPH